MPESVAAFVRNRWQGLNQIIQVRLPGIRAWWLVTSNKEVTTRTLTFQVKDFNSFTGFDQDLYKLQPIERCF